MYIPVLYCHFYILYNHGRSTYTMTHPCDIENSLLKWLGHKLQVCIHFDLRFTFRYDFDSRSSENCEYVPYGQGHEQQVCEVSLV